MRTSSTSLETIDLLSEKSIDLDNNRCNRILKWFCWCF